MSRPSSCSSISAGSWATRWRSGQARIDQERALGDRRAADVVAALEDEHRAPGAGQVRRGDEPVVAAADDHGVVARVGRRAHPEANR
jgi:hypothetical protein